MCRLFAYLGAIRDLSPYLTKGEACLRNYAAEQPDGWGIARWSGGRPAVRKAAKRADEDPLFMEIAGWTRSPSVLAHLRKASEGSPVTDENAHPFHHGPFAFAHNGTLHGLDAPAREKLMEELSDDLRQDVRGTTDSEIAFFLCLSEILRRWDTLDVPIELAAEALAATRKRLLATFPGVDGNRSEANFLLGNGLGFAALRHGKPLRYFEGEDFSCVASLPIGRARGEWREVPEGALLLLRPGEAPEIRML